MDRPPSSLHPIATLIRSAQEAQTAGKTGLAIRTLETAIERAPDNPQILNMLGVIRLEQGNAEAAYRLFDRALAADPKASSLWINRAKAQRELGDRDGEKESLAAALDRDPYLLIAHLRKAELHDKLGEEAEALAAWRAVLSICENVPDPSPALMQLAEQAKAYVEPRSARISASLEDSLAQARAGIAVGETRRFDAAVDHALGKRRIYTSQSSGLHFPFLPADEFFARKHFPWLSTLEAATDAIRREFLAALAEDGQQFAPYVDQASGAEHNVWSELSRSTRWSAYYLWRYGIRNDAACARCPATAAALEALPRADQPNRAPTAFFSLLARKTRIPPHTGVSNTRAIVHLPLVVPAGCGFRVGGETRQWKVGQAFAFDDTIEHEAWNDSDEMRAVLIFDVWNPHLSETERGLLRTFYTATDATGLIPSAISSF